MGNLLKSIRKPLLVITVVSSTLTLAAAEEVSDRVSYTEAAEARATNERNAGNIRLASDIYLYWAGKARDEGAVSDAVELFKRAVQQDPEYVRAHVLYADYLTGYRGQFEAAYEHYRIAEDLLNAKGYGYLDNSPTGKRLQRSMSIFHRDTKDGVEVIKTHNFAVSFGTVFEFGKEAPSTVVTDLYTKLYRTEHLALAGEIPSGVFETLHKDIPRRRDTTTGSISGVLRFRNRNLPTFTFTATRKNIDDITHDVYANGGRGDFYDTAFTSYEASAVKNMFITQRLDFNSRFSINSRRSSADSPTEFKEHTKQYIADFRLRYNAGFQTYSLQFGGSLADIKNDDSGDDAANSAFASFRYAVWPKPRNNVQADKGSLVTMRRLEANERFRGRRSTQLEFGIGRRERDYKGDGITRVDTHVTYTPFISYEEYGLLGGYLDLLCAYNYTRDKLFSNQEGLSAALPQPRHYLDSFDEHKFTIRPVWVPVYNLYDSHQEFQRGIEHLTVAFPISVTLSDGPFDRYRIGVEFFKRIVGYKIAFIPEFGFDFAYYPELEESDWGFFVKLSIGPGDPYRAKSRR